MRDDDSPFLAVPTSEWLAANDHAFVIADRFPVKLGGTAQSVFQQHAAGCRAPRAHRMPTWRGVRGGSSA